MRIEEFLGMRMDDPESVCLASAMFKNPNQVMRVGTNIEAIAPDLYLLSMGIQIARMSHIFNEELRVSCHHTAIQSLDLNLTLVMEAKLLKSMTNSCLRPWRMHICRSLKATLVPRGWPGPSRPSKPIRIRVHVIYLSWYMHLEL
jgi:hypothetical protein